MMESQYTDVSESGGDYGSKFTGNCPKCGTGLVISELNSPFDNNECDCGYNWSLVVKIITTDDEVKKVQSIGKSEDISIYRLRKRVR